MIDSKTTAMLEAMLFASGEAVPIKRLAEVMEVTEAKMFSFLEELKQTYEKDKSSGIRLISLEDSYQLCTKSEYYECVRNLTEKKRRASLTNAGLEVLSIVAYNQPVTRSTIEFIRGVNSDGSLNNLIASGLVEEVGRLDAPGRPILFGTSEEFLRCFNLSSISELPDVELEYNFTDMNGNLASAQQLEFEQEKRDADVPDFEINTDDDKDIHNQENDTTGKNIIAESDDKPNELTNDTNQKDPR